MNKNIKICYCYYPTEDEFSEPSNLIPLLESKFKCGLIKITPPNIFNPVTQPIEHTDSTDEEYFQFHLLDRKVGNVSAKSYYYSIIKAVNEELDEYIPNIYEIINLLKNYNLEVERFNCQNYYLKNQSNDYSKEYYMSKTYENQIQYVLQYITEFDKFVYKIHFKTNKIKVQDDVFTDSKWNFLNLTFSIIHPKFHQKNKASVYNRRRIEFKTRYSIDNYKVNNFYLASLRYIHKGGPCITIGIPSKFVDKFEKYMQYYIQNTNIPNQNQKYIYIIFKILETWNFEHYIAIQQTGEFLYIGYQMYYFTYYLNDTIIEKTTIATKNWLNYIPNYINKYKNVPEFCDINTLYYDLKNKYIDFNKIVKGANHSNKKVFEKWIKCVNCEKWRRMPHMNGKGPEFFDIYGGFNCQMLKDVNCQVPEENFDDIVEIKK